MQPLPPFPPQWKEIQCSQTISRPPAIWEQERKGTPPNEKPRAHAGRPAAAAEKETSFFFPFRATAHAPPLSAILEPPRRLLIAGGGRWRRPALGGRVGKPLRGYSLASMTPRRSRFMGTAKLFLTVLLRFLAEFGGALSLSFSSWLTGPQICMPCAHKSANTGKRLLALLSYSRPLPKGMFYEHVSSLRPARLWTEKPVITP